ncbi:MAG: dockerin type I repeat-containing protein [Candidatus Komeilibacteria bacterium]
MKKKSILSDLFFENFVVVIIVIWTLGLAQSGRVGDLNQDGQINVQDVVQVLGIILEYNDTPTEYQLWSSDVNVDSVINIQDIVIMVSVIMQTYDACPEFQELCSDNLTQCCYEITGNDIEWEIQLFGGDPGDISAIRDGWINNENDIWLFGEIHPLPGGPGSPNYYYAHWDGEEWIVGAPEYVNSGYEMYEFNGVFGLSSTNVWAVGTGPIHFDGSVWFQYLPPACPSGMGSIYKLWGTSYSQMFFGMESGDIILWDGAEFEIMQTSTGTGSEFGDPTPVHDMWGTGPDNVWAMVKKVNTDPAIHPTTVMRYDGNGWEDWYVITDVWPIEGEVSGTIYNGWAYGDTLYLMSAWYGLWRESITTGEGYYDDMDVVDNQVQFFKGRGLTGNHPNDIYSASWQCKFAHWNGEFWYHGYEVYDYFQEQNVLALCYGMDVRGDTIVLFGDVNLGQYGWVARGTRN